MLARKSNLVLGNKSDDSGKYLLRKDVAIQEEMLVVSFRWTKTLQFGERKLKLPLVRSNSLLCPVSAFMELITLVPASPDSPFFTFDKGRDITYYMFQNKLKSFISDIGLDPKDYSSHSFRRGGATLAFCAGIPVDLIQLQGDWPSDTYKIYLSFSLSDKVQVAKLMEEFIASGK